MFAGSRKVYRSSKESCLLERLVNASKANACRSGLVNVDLCQKCCSHLHYIDPISVERSAHPINALRQTTSPIFCGRRLTVTDVLQDIRDYSSKKLLGAVGDIE